MNDILIDYDNNKNKYDAFSKTLASLVNNLMLVEGIKIHSVTYRVKERDSLEKKVSSKDKYTCIDEVTDIIGLRIITHFADEVDKVAELIEREFSVDRVNTIDKRASLEPDKFGYLSLHYVISLKENRLAFFEYKSYVGVKAEIQIRSILQHSWAEIEHDIGYKSSVEVPKIIKRQFSRLAGLLELADQEFLAIKTSLNNYEVKVSQSVWSSKTEDFKIDKVTLREFMRNSPVIKELTSSLKESASIIFDPNASYNGPAIKYLNTIGIRSINQLEELFRTHKESIIKRSEWLAEKYGESITLNRPVEILAIYLPQIIVFKSDGIDGLRNLLEQEKRESSHISESYYDDFAESLKDD